MFRNTFQSGFLSILYSLGNKPLQLWDKHGAWCALYWVMECVCATPAQVGWSIESMHVSIAPMHKRTNERTRAVENGAIKRVADDEVQSGVLEITGPFRVCGSGVCGDL